MICRHCNVAIHEDFKEFPLFPGRGKRYLKVGWSISAQICPECGEPIIELLKGTPCFEGASWERRYTGIVFEGCADTQLWPFGSSRTCPVEVPDEIKEDFLEAASVISISAKASAALSRRCLQTLLVEYAKVKNKDLSKQIQEVLDSRTLSSDLAEQLDAIRNIGNFSAHPQKDKSTGEILPVEPREAEWNLDVLEELFDHYFVKPERIRKRKEELNQKLAAAGKPPLPIS